MVFQQLLDQICSSQEHNVFLTVLQDIGEIQEIINVLFVMQGVPLAQMVVKIPVLNVKQILSHLHLTT